jgi:hypothetical protein
MSLGDIKLGRYRYASTSQCREVARVDEIALGSMGLQVRKDLQDWIAEHTDGARRNDPVSSGAG